MLLITIFLYVFTVSAIIITTPSAANADTKAACLALEAKTKVHYPRSKSYRAEMDIYWSATCKEYLPACIIQPVNAAEVSAAVLILQQYPNATFTVKSGGHDPNPGFASVHDGILVALGNMKGARYDKGKNVARVKPGGHWKDVVADLAPSGVTVVTGRLDVVGVAGLISGGGLSFLSAQYGMSADSVLEFETVLPNGTITRINKTNHPTLFRAMKGSTSSFGIITEFVMKAVQMAGKVWGGAKIYTADKEAQLLAAFEDFTSAPTDPKAAIILTIERIGGVKAFLMFYFYHGESPPKGVYKKFENIAASLDTTKAQTYGELLAANGAGTRSVGFQRTSFRTMTLPVIPGDKGAIQKEVIKAWEEAHDAARQLSSTGAFVGSLALQSFPNLIGKQSEANGGNAMGLRASDGPRFVVELTNIWMFASDDPKVRAASKNVTDLIEKRYKAHRRHVELERKMKREELVQQPKIESHLPYFLNDAAADQDVMRSFREYDTFKRLQQQIDHKGFLKRIGGHKY